MEALLKSANAAINREDATTPASQSADAPHNRCAAQTRERASACDGLSDVEDVELIRRIAADRDRDAFRQFFERYGRKVKAFMIRSGAVADAADEAAQETMLAVWRRAETFDPNRASVPAWLFAIARNKRVDLLRRGARPAPDPEDPTYLPEPEPAPDERIGAARRDAAVRAALGALSEDQRKVVILSFYEGCAHSEISERLGVPLGTVKSRLRLAFGKLRASLGVSFKDELSSG